MEWNTLRSLRET